MNVISWSGGHDSTVMLHYLIHQKGFSDFKVVFANSSINFPETLAYINQIVRDFGIENQFVCLKPKETFFERLMRYRFWPSIKALWCRKYLKMDCFKAYYNSFDEDLVSYIGISHADSGFRRKKYREPISSKKFGKKLVTIKLPLLTWTDEDKTRYLRENNIPENPVYGTMGVSGCYFCPFYHEKEYLKLKRYHPRLFDRLLSCETEIGKRALPDFWLRDIEKQYEEETNLVVSESCDYRC